MQDPRPTVEAMKDGHGAAQPGGTSELAQRPTGSEAESPDAAITEGGHSVPDPGTEAG